MRGLDVPLASLVAGARSLRETPRSPTEGRAYRPTWYASHVSLPNDAGHPYGTRFAQIESGKRSISSSQTACEACELRFCRKYSVMPSQ